MSDLRYGFVGLGQLGRRLAASLARAGFDVAVYDRDSEAGGHLSKLGAARATSVEEAVEGRNALITCLPSPAATRCVLQEGGLAGLGEGGCWIEMSTNDPAEIKERAAEAREHGVDTLEAPVTGGVHKAATGEITVLAGGDAELFEQHRKALAAMGDPVLLVGELGKASVLKVITNMLAFIHLGAAGEAMMLAKRAGIDLGVAFEGIRASSGNSFVHETESQVILSGSYDIGFTMDLACKDAEFAAALGDSLGVPLEIGAWIRDRFAQARERYGGDAQSPKLVRLLEEAVGEELRAEGFPASLDPA